MYQRSLLKEWKELYANASKTGYTITGKPLPTIAVISYLYDDSGNKYIGTYELSSVTYLHYKGLGLQEAAERAAANPFLLLEDEPTITVRSPHELHIRRVNSSPPKIIEEKARRERVQVKLWLQPYTGRV
jgi:hypothetical protein